MAISTLKTTTTERFCSILVISIKSAGDDVTAFMDFMAQRKRAWYNYNVGCNACRMERRYTINIIDTPVMLILLLEVQRALRVLD